MRKWTPHQGNRQTACWTTKETGSKGSVRLSHSEVTHLYHLTSHTGVCADSRFSKRTRNQKKKKKKKKKTKQRTIKSRGHAHAHTRTHAHTHSGSHTHTHTYTHTHTHTHTHNQAHTLIHTHTHTHKDRLTPHPHTHVNVGDIHSSRALKVCPIEFHLLGKVLSDSTSSVSLSTWQNIEASFASGDRLEITVPVCWALDTNN